MLIVNISAKNIIHFNRITFIKINQIQSHILSIKNTGVKRSLSSFQ